jgi:uncharacterized membrane protein
MKIKKSLKKVIILVALFAAFSSCENYVEDYQEIIVKECDPQISFINDIKPIIDNNCVSCHNGNQFPDLRTYNGISANSRIVKEQVVNRTMPIGGSLSNEEIELISCWIDNGSKNN